MSLASSSHIVVGSGPAGISCAMALIRRKLNVIMVDVGYQLDKSTLYLIENLKATAPENWSANQINTIKNPNVVLKSPHKLFFGSSHIYGDQVKIHSYEYENFGGNFSFAAGGFSNVWGAAMLPMREVDFKDWPYSFKELEPYYQEVLKFVPLAARQDNLEKMFPLYVTKTESLQCSSQGLQLLQYAKTYADKCQKAGFTVGASRLAIHVTNENHGCKYCGLCAYGCPYGSIYSTTETLNELKKNSNFTYLGDHFALNYSESQSSVSLKVLNLKNNLISEIQGKQLYLALGTLSTSRLVLESVGSVNRPLKILDNQFFMFPFFSFKKSKGALTEQGVTLSQAFLELQRKCLGSHVIHFQHYGMNDMIPNALKSIIPKFILCSRFFKEEILSRISIIQGFLHSDHSEGAELVLKNTPDGLQLRVKGNKNKLVERHIRKILFYFFRKSFLFGGIMIPGIGIKGRPGASYHLGGTLPMKKNPGPFECDSNGNLYGYSRVKIVDASGFPSLPASTITFSIMANAYRIGFTSPAL